MKLTIDLHPKLLRWLKALHEHGLHGITLKETALRLIEEGIRERVRDKELFLERRKHNPAKGERDE